MSELNSLLKRALAVEREYRKMASLPGQKLKAKAYLDAAMKNARCDAKDLARLRRGVEEPPRPRPPATRDTARQNIFAERAAQLPPPPVGPPPARDPVS